MRRSVEGSDDIDNNVSQVYIKIIKKSIWFSDFAISYIHHLNDYISNYNMNIWEKVKKFSLKFKVSRSISLKNNTFSYIILIVIPKVVINIFLKTGPTLCWLRCVGHRDWSVLGRYRLKLVCLDFRLVHVIRHIWRDLAWNQYLCTHWELFQEILPSKSIRLGGLVKIGLATCLRICFSGVNVDSWVLTKLSLRGIREGAFSWCTRVLFRSSALVSALLGASERWVKASSPKDYSWCSEFMI